MDMGRQIATATFMAWAVLAWMGTKADAAQCGRAPAGFEAWKRDFAEEARAKGISASAVAALMQANYAAATIAADRGQRSFGLSLDQFLAKRARRPSSRAGAHSSNPRRRSSHPFSNATAFRRGRFSPYGEWRRASEVSACCRPSPLSPTTAVGQNFSPSSSSMPL
jgi:hypothetical protein